MKRKRIYIAIILFFVAAIGFTVARYRFTEEKRRSTVYVLQERKGAPARAPEWIETKERGKMLLAAVRADAGDLKSKLALAALFIREARVTGNHMYYDMAALHYINDILEKSLNHFEALSFKAMVYVSQHHFAEGVAIAEQAIKINPHNAYIYGILVDGNIEMGNYDAAVKHSDRMVSIRPDLTSYSRISYLREIHGDYPGAIEAMKMAVDAGAPGEESTEWSRVQLGHLYENTGDLNRAKMQYMISLRERPGYAYALAGLGRIAVAGNEYPAAVMYYRQADASVADYSFKEGMAEAYRLSGKKNKAAALTAEVIREMTQNAKAGRADESIGHYSDRELANAFLAVNDYRKALDHALLEYNRRPGNIDVNETLAWVYYCSGKYDKAIHHMKVALKTKSQNPTLLCRAGLVFSRAGDKATAKSFLQAAFRNHPNITSSLKEQSLATLNSL